MAPAAEPVQFNNNSFQPLPEMQAQQPFSTSPGYQATPDYGATPGYQTSPNFQVVSPQGNEKSIKFDENEARRMGNYEDAIDDDMEYDSDEEHAQDWNVKTHKNDSWATQTRRKNSLFGKTEIINPHAENPKHRNGSMLSQFRSSKDVSGNHVITSGFEDHVPEILPKVEKTSRSLSTASNGASSGRRGSVLSLFTTGKDAKGRNIMNSGEWDDMD